MATGIRNRGRVGSRRNRATPYSLPCWRRENLKKKEMQLRKEMQVGRKSRIDSEKKDWEDATCSVCMEYPHNAVLLLCSSHEKGCRPYMCGTSYRYSNCLDQFKKAHTRVASPPHGHRWHELANSLASEVMELACPLCRGQVKGMTVVEPAREYLNGKKRCCTQDECSFGGTYKELRKHVKQEHPFARPHEVDPTHEQKWRSLEHEREHDDVLSTIRATMPGARVLGDYVIEGSRRYGFDSEDDDEGEADEDYGGSEGGIDDPTLFTFFMYHAIREAGNANASFNDRLRRARGYTRRLDDIEEGFGFPLGSGATAASSSLQGGSNDIVPMMARRQVGRERSERRRRRRSQRRTVSDVPT